MKEDSRRRILFYGDSNTYGYDPRFFQSDYFPTAELDRYPEDIRWTTLVRRACEQNWEVLDNGMNGREIPSTDLTLQAFKRTLKRNFPLDVFAVMLGSNDLLFYSPDPRLVLERMKLFLTAAREQLDTENRDAEILVLAPPFTDLEGGTLTKATLQLSRLYEDLARERGCRFLNTCFTDISLAYDGLHFSEEGHRQFAGHVIDCLNHWKD